MEKDPISKKKKCETNLLKMEDKELGSTSEENMESFSSNSCCMDVSIVQNQKHSTPHVIKLSTKAVSSTPNQEIFNISKLTRNVSAQTNFTLNARYCEEFNEHLKAHCIEAPVEETHLVLSSAESSCLNTTSDLSSPLRNLCSSKMGNFDGTPFQNKQLIRKLSLRSKTMICSALEKSKDIPKKILTKHKSMEERRLFSNTFTLLPNPKTPPSSVRVGCHNPFERDLQDRLSKSIFSPDVFENVISPSQDSEDLRWTIEDISSINPVPIEEDFSIPSEDEDPERESQVQEEIDRYFSETHSVLSPDDLPRPGSATGIKKSHFLGQAAASTPRKFNVNVSRELKNCSTQTTLSLPEVLPVELEESVSSYFKYFEVDDFNLNVSSLRRKLFFHTEDEPPSPVRYQTSSSPLTKDFWKTESPPISIVSGRHFTPVGRQQELSSPEVSPVVNEYSNLKAKNDSWTSCKKTLHHYFSGDSKRNTIERKKEVVNSTVIAVGEIDSSAQPGGQDTGYHTEDSVSSHLHFSTPTQTVM